MRLKTLFIFLTIIVSGLLTTSVTRADSAYVCQCQAAGPGFEAGITANKICSYNCKCQIFPEGNGSIVQKDVKVVNTISTAYSFDSWDAGSHICHGQYAWRPTIGAENWRIQVRFSPFTINSAGSLFYEDLTEIAPGFHSSFQRSEAAPEILENLSQQLF
ncbi:MAG: hypothetical protein H7061_00960 [Bdellovibrionaceae bacterium]|nr:hypothetical protein [Bdellovibrio sp.]